MDYRNLFGIAAIILSGAVFLHSLNSANAFPQGPNVSMGSNPIENFYGVTTLVGNGAVNTVFTNNTNNDFIITQFNSQNRYCALAIDGALVLSHYNPSLYGAAYVDNHNNFQGKIKILSNSTIGIKHNDNGTRYCSYYIEGYYTHP